ncbi:Abi family protein [Thermicanus aegyptius]|uniref:Abi family protein n=1 Tax=Thermicanus aegyptius TaxID=94009 RepID=UPI000412A23D|nr:Abi family protein [Thermicanus aegyptius]
MSFDANHVQIKQPTTFEQQIEILRSRGLIVNDEEFAINVLKTTNYYRLTAYTLPLKKDDKFYQGITFEHIYKIYQFDAELRLLLMSIFEQIEIAFRTHTAYLIAHKYGPLGYRDKNNFRYPKNHSKFLMELDENIKNSKELFISHHFNKYGGRIPIWVAVEVLTFGLLSKLFNIMKVKDQKIISRDYYNGIHPSEISSWLYAIATVRNRCAHYSRLYNRKLSITPYLPIEAKNLDIKNDELFSIIYILKKLIKAESFWTSWITKLEAIIEQYQPEVDIKLMGFPYNWVNILRN